MEGTAHSPALCSHQGRPNKNAESRNHACKAWEPDPRRASEDASMKDVRQAQGAEDQSTTAPEINVDIVGTRIREYREARRKSITQVAEQAGLEPAVLEAVESGKTDPTLTTLTKIAESLEVPVAQLFGPLSPRAIEAGKAWEQAPSEIQGAVKTILEHPVVKA